MSESTSDAHSAEAVSQRDHATLREGLRTALTRTVNEPAAVDRLVAYAARRFDVAGGGDETPAVMTLRVARALGAPEPLSVSIAVATGLFYSAADLADDVADGDTPALVVGRDLNDVCRLLFAHQRALLDLPDLDDDRRLTLLRIYADGGLRMADGQAADLAGTDATDAPDPEAIARGKAGAEFSAMLRAAAVCAGRPDAPLGEFGMALGTLVQVFTDYLDLFAQPVSEDWVAAKPTLPVRRALADPTHSDAVACLLAGNRGDLDRMAAGRWHLIEAGAAAALADLAARSRETLESSLEAAGRPAELEDLAARVLDWVDGVLAALDAMAGAERPTVPPLRTESARCVDAIDRFLRADPTYEAATETHRWGLFGATEVRADLFGRLVIIDCLQSAGCDPALWQPALEVALGRLDPDGIRYYPGHPEIPTDADDTGMVLALTAGRQGTDRARLGACARHLVRNRTDDGLVYTWLADGERHTRASLDEGWEGGRCPVSAAHALLGLWCWDASEHRPVVLDGARRLAELLAEDAAPHSLFYGPVAVDALATRLLERLRPEMPADDVAAVDRALDASTARLVARRRLSGRFGDVVETALAAWALARRFQLDRPDVVRRALVDAQEPDGGYPADPYYVTFGTHMRPVPYAARVVTAALVRRALAVLPEPRE